MDKKDLIAFLKRHNLTQDQFGAIVGRTRGSVNQFGSRLGIPYYVRVIIKLIDERGGVHGLLPGR